MTHPPKSSAAPPAGAAVPTMPSIPPPPPPRAVVVPQGNPAPPAAPTPPEPRRRTAFAEGVDQLRAAATTEPGRLRVIGAVLALLVVAFGAVTAWQTTERSAAADDVLNNSQPLSSAAADIYRALADANTAASSGFLAGGQETPASRERYEKDIDTASAGLIKAAANSDPDSSAARTVSRLNQLLPEYKGLVERARTYNRQGYPVGGAYLRYANAKMQEQMLPEAENLYKSENRRLRSDYGDATPYPWAAIGLGVLALGALAWAQQRNYRRTNRVLNHGLVAATATTTVVLLWMVVGHSVARADLNASYDHGVRSLNVLHDARIASLKARGNENLTLVARGAETITVKERGVETTYDSYDYDFGKDIGALGKGLAEAEKLADDATGEKPVTAAVGNMTEWKKRHTEARKADDNGNYEDALNRVIGGKDATGECFDSVDANLVRAIDHETREFKQAAGDGLGALTGLPVGAALLAVLGAAGAVLGIGRRLSEYR